MCLEDITSTLEGRHYIPPQDGARFICGAAMSAEAWPRRTKNKVFVGPDKVKERDSYKRRLVRRKLVRRGYDRAILSPLGLEQLERMLRDTETGERMERITHIEYRWTLENGRQITFSSIDDSTAVLLDESFKDAARYRWLRGRKGLNLRSDACTWTRHDGTVFVATHYLAEGGTQHASAESLDATIDAAMAATQDSQS